MLLALRLRAALVEAVPFSALAAMVRVVVWGVLVVRVLARGPTRWPTTPQQRASAKRLAELLTHEARMADSGDAFELWRPLYMQHLRSWLHLQSGLPLPLSALTDVEVRSHTSHLTLSC